MVFEARVRINESIGLAALEHNIDQKSLSAAISNLSENPASGSISLIVNQDEGCCSELNIFPCHDNNFNIVVLDCSTSLDGLLKLPQKSREPTLKELKLTAVTATIADIDLSIRQTILMAVHQEIQTMCEIDPEEMKKFKACFSQPLNLESQKQPGLNRISDHQQP